MDDLIKTNIESGEVAVSARELHKALEATERFQNWFDRYAAYGLVEGTDFLGCKVFNTLARQELQDYSLTIDAAKQICMLQRSDKGKEYRAYLIKVEKAWNDPAAVMARAYKMAYDRMQLNESKVKELTAANDALTQQNQILTEQNGKLAIKAQYATEVLQSVDGLTFTQVAKDLGLPSAKKLETFLEQKKIIFWQSGQWMPYAKYSEKGYFTTRTVPIPTTTGEKRTRRYLIVTERGRAWLHFLFEKEKKKNAKEKKQAAVAAIPQVTYTQTEIFS